VRAEQTVAEMVVVALARQAEALSEGTDRPLEEAFAQVLKTPAGRLLGKLADGPHRHEKAAEWQGAVPCRRAEERHYMWLESYMEWLAGKKKERAQYHALLEEELASPRG
jgi:hypothetical protein